MNDETTLENRLKRGCEKSLLLFRSILAEMPVFKHSDRIWQKRIMTYFTAPTHALFRQSNNTVQSSA